MQLGIARDRPPQELQLPARLSFEIEQPERTIVHLHQHALLVVAGQDFPGERGHPEPQPAGAGLFRGRQQRYGGLDRVARQTDGLRGDDSPLVEDLHARRSTGESGGAERQPDFQQRTAQDARGYVGSSEFEIGIELGAADRHRVDPNPARPQIKEGLIEVLLPSPGHGVRPVAQQHDPGHRQRGEFVGHPGEAAEQIGTRPAEPELRSSFDPPSVIREAEEPGYELLPEEVAERGPPRGRPRRRRERPRAAPRSAGGHPLRRRSACSASRRGELRRRFPGGRRGDSTNCGRNRQSSTSAMAANRAAPSRRRPRLPSRLPSRR